jgi:hypothetical protein
MRRPQPWAVVASWRVLWGVLLLSAGAAAQPAEAAAPPPEAVDPRAGWRHEFSPAWHMATFWSKENSHYTFHSLSLGYLMSVNPSGPFVHLSWVVPLQARQDGRVNAISSLYQNSGGIDALLGWQWRMTVNDTLEFETGPGFHMNALNLGGRSGLTNFNALQLGPGGMGILRWRPGWRPASVGWSFGFVGALALDVYDPLRSNDLKLGLVLRLGGVVGVDLP